MGLGRVYSSKKIIFDSYYTLADTSTIKLIFLLTIVLGGAPLKNFTIPTTTLKVGSSRSSGPVCFALWSRQTFSAWGGFNAESRKTNTKRDGGQTI